MAAVRQTCLASTSGRRCFTALTTAPFTRRLHRLHSRRLLVQVNSLYSFSEAAEERVRGERRNRGIMKREARELLDVVRGLAEMSAKQLAAVEHLLPPGTAEAVGIAARLPRSNQGRKRQENLVAKMLRGQLTEQQMSKLADAVSVAVEYDGVYDDGDVTNLVAFWREGLLADEPAVVAEVYSYPREWAPDHQQLRALVRQVQQVLKEEQEQRLAQAAAASAEAVTQLASLSEGGSGSSSDEDAAPDATSQSTQPALEVDVIPGRRRGKRQELKSRSLTRNLTKVLRPLAIKVAEQQQV